MGGMQTYGDIQINSKLDTLSNENPSFFMPMPASHVGKHSI